MRTRIGLPLTLTVSPNWMRWPMWAGSALTEIRPSSISCSISSRDPRPAWASTLCNFGVSGWGNNTRLASSTATSSSSASNWPVTTSSKRFAGTPDGGAWRDGPASSSAAAGATSAIKSGAACAFWLWAEALFGSSIWEAGTAGAGLSLGFMRWPFRRGDQERPGHWPGLPASCQSLPARQGWLRPTPLLFR